MLIHVRSRQGGVYWSETGLWSPLIGVAKNSKTVADAEAFCRARKFNDVEIIVLNESQAPTAIPIESTIPPS